LGTWGESPPKKKAPCLAVKEAAKIGLLRSSDLAARKHQVNPQIVTMVHVISIDIDQYPGALVNIKIAR
jgi:hypothetical protein